MTISDVDKEGKLFECSHELTGMELYNFRAGISAVLIQTFRTLEKQLQDYTLNSHTNNGKERGNEM